jgi:ribosome biogenesis GTPase
MSKKRKQKVRAEFRRRYGTRARSGDLTRRFAREQMDQPDDLVESERVSGKGELTRKRTVTGAEAASDETGLPVDLHVDQETRLPGRVLSVHGLASRVATSDGKLYRCTTRRLLKSLSTDQRHVIAVGDRVWFLPDGESEGVIERVEPRHGVLSRTSRGRQHVLVANVDQLLIVTSAAEPTIKPNLIDRLLVTAERAEIPAIICINKVDLVDLADLQPLVGVYGQLGYGVLLLSALRQTGIERLQAVTKDKSSVVVGQSGVGKSSLLNAMEPGLELRVRTVSAESQKGRHTTTAAQLVPLENGGFVVDTPGIRQFQLWDVTAEEVAGFYRDVRPFVSLCRFPNCTHTHEADCAVKDAAADGKIDVRRYESYCQLFAGDQY